MATREDRWEETRTYKDFLISTIMADLAPGRFAEEELKRMTTRTLERIFDNC